MDQTDTYQKGDIIIEFGTAYEVTSVRKQANLQGKLVDCVYYRPYFVTDSNKSLTYSIPVDSLSKTNKRRPLSKEAVEDIFNQLTPKIAWKSYVDADEAKKTLNSNDPQLVASLVKQLWLEGEQFDKELPYSKKEIYEQALQQLSEEVAVVWQTSLDKARETLMTKLDRAK